MKHLTYEDRIFLDALLRSDIHKYTLTEISEQLKKSKSTISRELKRNRTSGNNLMLPTCKLTNRFPYVCNRCKKRSSCKYQKFYYNPKVAQNYYNSRLVQSRNAVIMDYDLIEHFDEILRDRIRNKGQSTLHLFHSLQFPYSLSTFYRYVNNDVFPGINNEMLPRQYSFKIRKSETKKEIYINNNSPLKKGRTYKNFLEYTNKYKDIDIVEMDTVIGKRNDKSCLLTILFRNSKLMLIYKIKHYNPSSVVDVFTNLRKKLGLEDFKKLFKVILTDNGWEFSLPQDIEIDYETGEKLCNIYYCDPYSSWQKPNVERNHQFIRYIRPKSISFDDLTKKNTIDMCNHINSTKRASLNYKTPFELFHDQYGINICKKLDLKSIDEDLVDLSYTLLK